MIFFSGKLHLLRNWKQHFRSKLPSSQEWAGRNHRRAHLRIEKAGLISPNQQIWDKTAIEGTHDWKLNGSPVEVKRHKESQQTNNSSSTRQAGVVRGNQESTSCKPLHAGTMDTLFQSQWWVRLKGLESAQENGSSVSSKFSTNRAENQVTFSAKGMERSQNLGDFDEEFYEVLEAVQRRGFVRIWRRKAYS